MQLPPQKKLNSTQMDGLYKTAWPWNQSFFTSMMYPTFLVSRYMIINTFQIIQPTRTHTLCFHPCLYHFPLISSQGLLVRIIMASVKCQGRRQTAAHTFSPRCLGNILIPSGCRGLGLLPSFQLLFFYILGPVVIWPANVISWGRFTRPVTSLIAIMNHYNAFITSVLFYFWQFNNLLRIDHKACSHYLADSVFLFGLFFSWSVYTWLIRRPLPYPPFLVSLPRYVLVVCWPSDVRQIVR